MKGLREVDVAAPVVAWLRDLRFEVYQEVTVGGARADIVAVRGPLVWVVEAKQTWSLALLEQAAAWLPLAHHVSVAVPFRRKAGHSFGRRIAGDLGIGVFEVGGSRVEVDDPDLHRNVKPGKIVRALHEEQKTCAPAGNAEGRFFSPFQGTCRAVLEAVKASPGLTMRELVAGIKHHYHSPASARSALAKWIAAGTVPGVELRRDGKVLQVYPAEVRP